jgi:ferredoxin
MPETPPETRRAGTKRLRWVLLTAPLVILLSAWAGAMAHGSIARLHPVVRLAERVAAEEQGQFDKRSIESDAFRAGQKPLTELYDEANALKRRFQYGSAWLGAFLGLVVVGKLIRFSVIRKNKDYVPDRGACLSCGRCFAYCPVKNGESDA